MERVYLGKLIPFQTLEETKKKQLIPISFRSKTQKPTPMKQLPDKTSRQLTLRQRKYCQARANGFNQAQAYLSAGYKPSSPINANKNAHNLERHPDVAQYLARLREESFAKDALTLKEKRSLLARIARTSPSEVDATSPICQEYSEEIDSSGNVKRKVKLPSKIEAIRTDNQMAGHSWNDQKGEDVNPFLAIVSLFSQNSYSSPTPSPVIEAEITQC